MNTIGSALGRLAVTALLRTGALLTGFIAAVAVAGVAWGAQDVVLSTARPEGGRLVVEGGISGIRAGEPSAPMRLTLRNPGDDARRVTRVTADAAATDPACPASYLTVGEWAGDVTVPAGGSTTVTVPVAVGAGLPARCAAVGWTLRYTAY